MRRQDELLNLYPGRDVMTRKFLLSQMDGLGTTFDSDEMLAFLHAEARSADDPVAHQALFTLSNFLTANTRRRYGLEANSLGVWSSHGQMELIERVRAGKLDALDGVDGTAEVRTRHAGFLHRSGALVRALLQAMGHPDPGAARLARLALGYFPLKSVGKVLREAGPKDRVRFTTALPFAMIQEAGTDARGLVRWLGSGLGSEPDLALLVGMLPGDIAVRFITQVAGKAGLHTRVNLALATSRHRSTPGIRPALELLIRKDETWVVIHVLASLERLEDPSNLDLVQKIYHQSTIDFVKIQAVRTAGSMPGEASVAFCLEAIESPSSSIHAQALESLVRLKCDRETLEDAAEPLVDSASLRARINAVLACRRADEDGLPEELAELLLSNDPLGRLETAFAMGYLQNRKSLTNLATLANLDPEPRVRLQAIKSLSKFPARHAIPCLIPLLRYSDEAGAMAVARVLTRYEDDEADHVAYALMHEIPVAASPFHAGLLYRTLGTLAGKNGYSRATVMLREGLEGPDLSVAAAAAEGCVMYGGSHLESLSPLLVDLARRGDPRDLPQGLFGLFLAGELGAADELAKIVARGEGPAFGPALKTALELGLLLPQPGLGLRYPRLDRKLQELALEAAGQRFAASGEISTPRLPAPQALATDRGEFPVTRKLKPLPPPPAMDPEEVEAALGSSARPDLNDPQLSAHLARSRGQAGEDRDSFQDRLNRDTYLLGEAPPASEDPSS